MSLRVLGRYLFATAKGVQDLPDDWFIWYKYHGPAIDIRLMAGNREVGHIKLLHYEQCCDTYIVSNVSAPSGWGPFLYDLAMDFSGAPGIMSDRGQVSPAAEAVWNHYYRNRHDVTKYWVPDSACGTECPVHDEDDMHPLDYRYVNQNGLVAKLKALGKLVRG